MKNRWLSFFLAKRDLATHLYVLSFVLFIVGVVLGGWFFVTMSASRSAAFFVDGEDEEVSVEEAVVPESICEFSRFLDGVCVDSEEEQSVPVVAVMVENHVDARPLSGMQMLLLCMNRRWRGISPDLWHFFYEIVTL